MTSKRELEDRIKYIERNLRDIPNPSSRLTDLQMRVMKYENSAEYRDKKLDVRISILEDAITMIARTLDANNIREACGSCGQKLPKEKDCC
jgi:DNA repair exonuclease SbcCD ATPase subunit